MRKLTFEDLFVAVRVIDRANIRDEMVEIINTAASKKDAMDVQRIGIFGIIRTLGVFAKPDTAAAVYEFLSGPMEMTPAEVKAMSLPDLKKCIEYIFMGEDVIDFFGSLSGILGRS